MQRDRHCNVSTYKHGGAEEGHSSSPVGLLGTPETLHICKKLSRMEGDQLRATIVGGKFLRIKIRNKRRTILIPLESALEQCPETDKHVVPFSMEALES